MNWTDYQQAALSFVAVEGDLREYVAYGLLAEAGEVAGVYAKRVRGDDFDFRARLLGEIGDAFWFCAVGAHLCGIDFGFFEREYKMRAPDVFQYERVEKLVTGALSFSGRIRTYDFKLAPPYILAEEPVKMLAYILAHENVTVSEVLTANIAKLTARQQAGTIRGSGEGVRR